jgi:serine/threonine protein phosphatase PrpC
MGTYSISIEQALSQGHDRAEVFEFKYGTGILLADGAGSSKQAYLAAEQFISLAKDSLLNQPFSDDPLWLEQIFRQIDIQIAKKCGGNETTGICSVIHNNQILGASVGDSKCWLFNQTYDYELTQLQYRKPLLGTGSAIPVGFGPMELNGSIVVGSDGLFNYISIDNIKAVITQNKTNLTELLINNVRLPSGQLQDDCSVVIYKL